MNQKRLEIARHESGHAVMALICRRRVLKISLKVMDSPSGTGKYLGATMVEPLNQKVKLTINDAIRQAKIGLGGYASEALFSPDGSIKVGCDDLTKAVSWIEVMMQNDDFRDRAVRLPMTPPGAFEMIGDPVVKACIVSLLDSCVNELAPFKRLIQQIAEQLSEKEEISEDEVAAFFNAYES